MIVAGAAETGKTVACLHYLHCLMLDHPGAQAAILRKRQVDMAGTCLQTYQQKVLPPDAESSGLVRVLGATKPERFMYRNGSTIWVGGLDNPGKTLSAERDVIYVNQAEELEVTDWETLTTRTTGRAGHMPFSFTFGDCNPAHTNHWILQRQAAGHLTVLTTTHKDNPRLYNPDGTPTKEGQATMTVLGRLSGARHKRLFLGQWGDDSEGALWRRDWIKRHSEAPQFREVVVAVDPTGTVGGDECGIIAVGVTRENGKPHVWVIADWSLHGSPAQWATKAVTLYEQVKANWLMIETNFGGDMVKHTIRSVAGGEAVAIKEISVSRGKAIRAEPIAAVYEEGRGHHVGTFQQLEDELCNWTPGNKSPNRLDALVMGAAKLVGGTGSGRGT